MCLGWEGNLSGDTRPVFPFLRGCRVREGGRLRPGRGERCWVDGMLTLWPGRLPAEEQEGEHAACVPQAWFPPWAGAGLGWPPSLGCLGPTSGECSRAREAGRVGSLLPGVRGAFTEHSSLLLAKPELLLGAQELVGLAVPESFPEDSRVL